MWCRCFLLAFLFASISIILNNAASALIRGGALETRGPAVDVGVMRGRSCAADGLYELHVISSFSPAMSVERGAFDTRDGSATVKRAAFWQWLITEIRSSRAGSGEEAREAWGLANQSQVWSCRSSATLRMQAGCCAAYSARAASRARSSESSVAIQPLCASSLHHDKYGKGNKR